MSEWFWKKISFFAGWMAILFLFCLIILAANIEIKDLDLWLHLASGRYILENGTVPAADIFSCTLSQKPWINHEWLFQVIVYAVYHLAGIDGLIGFQVVVVGLTFVLLLMLGYDRERQAAPLWVLFLILLVYQTRFTLRPDIFSLLFLTLYVFILAFHLQDKGTPWVLFGLQILWSNMHGFFILGPLFTAVQLLGEWLKRRVPLPYQWNKVGRLTNAEYARLGKIFLVVLAACFLNPYFFKGVLYPLKVFVSLSGENKIFFEHIQELRSPLRWETLFSWMESPELKALILISSVSFLLNLRRIDLGALILWLIFLLSALHAARNAIYFAFAAYFAFLVNFQHLTFARIFRTRLIRGHHKYWASVVAKIILMAWIAHFINEFSSRGYYDFDRYERKNELGGISLRNYPLKAVDFLAQNKISGNFFNDFNSGAYLIGRVFPRIKVFIDGRTEVYGAEFFRTYSKIWRGDKELFEEAVQKYQLSGAFLNSVYVPAPAELIAYLYGHKEWVLVYFDYDAAIFLRNIPQNKEWIEKYAVDFSQWQPPPTDLMKLGLQKATPYRHVNRAYALFNMKLYDKALQEAEEGLKIEPYNPRLYMLLGKISLERKDYAAAFEHLRKAKLVDSDVWIRYYLAVSFYHLGEMRQAREQGEFVLKMQSAHAPAMFLLSLIHAAQQNYVLSKEMMEKAHGLAPHATTELVQLAELLTARKQYLYAQDVRDKILKIDPANKDIAEISTEIDRHLLNASYE